VRAQRREEETGSWTLDAGRRMLIFIRHSLFSLCSSGSLSGAGPEARPWPEMLVFWRAFSRACFLAQWLAGASPDAGCAGIGCELFQVLTPPK
jgi:hypothetical protein